MAYIHIPMPGRTTSLAEGPWVRVAGRRDKRVRFIIKYEFRSVIDDRLMYGEITFHDVLEYRWIHHGIIYEDFPDDISVGTGFGLVDITNSMYKEKMLSKNVYGQFPNMRLLGGNVSEADLHHYYLFFEDFGVFHVLAFDVTTHGYVRQRTP